MQQCNSKCVGLSSYGWVIPEAKGTTVGRQMTGWTEQTVQQTCLFHSQIPENHVDWCNIGWHILSNNEVGPTHPVII